MFGWKDPDSFSAVKSFIACWIFAAASFPSFVVNQTRFVILISQTKFHVLIWINNFWFEEPCLYGEIDVVIAGNYRKLGNQKCSKFHFDCLNYLFDVFRELISMVE